MVLTGASLELPTEIEAASVTWELAMPTRDEYRRTIATVVESLDAHAARRWSSQPADLDELAARRSAD